MRPSIFDKRLVIAPSGEGMFGVFEQWKVVELGAVNADGRWTITERWLPREQLEGNDGQWQKQSPTPSAST